MNRPRPVLTANAIAGLFTGIAGVIGFLGYANVSTQLGGEAQGIGAAVAFLIPALTHLLTGHVAQQQVTPLSSPVAADGSPLVAASTVAERNSAAVLTSQAAADDLNQTIARLAKRPVTVTVDGQQAAQTVVDDDTPLPVETPDSAPTNSAEGS